MNNVTARKTAEPFAIVCKRILDDPRLSWRAKGIVAYLIGKPDGWKLRVSDLVKHGTDGKHAIRAALNELRDYGYAQFTRHRQGGVISEGEWEISDSPVFTPRSKNQDVEPPRSDFQEEGNQEEGNQHLSNNDSNKIDHNKKEELSASKTQNKTLKTSPPQPPTGAAPLPQLPEELEHLEPLWKRWIEHRRQIKKPLTVMSALEHISIMETMTEPEVRASMSYSINGGYPGLYAPKKSHEEKKPAGPARCIL